MSKNGGVKQSIHAIHVKAEKAMKEAVAETIQDHARTGDPLAIWRNGKVVWVPAEKLLQQRSRSREK